MTKTQSGDLIDIHQLARRALATVPQIEHLIRLGLVTPAHEAPRRGMSRLFSPSSVRYVALAARLLAFGVSVEDIRTMQPADDPAYELKAIIGDDQPMFRHLSKKMQAILPNPNKSFVDHIWDQLNDPEKCDGVESLVVFRITDPSTGELLHYQHFFTSADSLASAARTEIPFFVINMKALKRRIETDLD